MTHIKNISKIILTISLFVLYNLHAEGKSVTQELEPHPFLGGEDWHKLFILIVTIAINLLILRFLYNKKIFIRI